MDTVKPAVVAALESVERQISEGDDPVQIKLSIAKVARALNGVGGGGPGNDLRIAIDSVRSALDRGDQAAAQRKLRLAIAFAMTDL